MNGTAALRVRDAMTRAPLTVTPEAPLGVALGLMGEHEIRHVPVVDQGGRLVGMITDRDLRKASLARFHALRDADEDLRVQDVMTSTVVTTDPEMPLPRAAALMYERRIGSLPVVEDGRLVGMLTERDLLRALMTERPDRTEAVEPFVR